MAVYQTFVIQAALNTSTLAVSRCRRSEEAGEETSAWESKIIGAIAGPDAARAGGPDAGRAPGGLRGRE
jgi:hypothetical protein